MSYDHCLLGPRQPHKHLLTQKGEEEEQKNQQQQQDYKEQKEEQEEREVEILGLRLGTLERGEAEARGK